ncbi:hypothetical protein BJY01DRAFT_260665 [Aspergillus pseudoustus]|uniref:PKD domain-containing protein n=1 Tax=Aspergillus pseudoustus TaxID=1810923 RepID=A0ABR4ITH5_9EURO
MRCMLGHSRPILGLECTPLTPNGPLQITADCIDPTYNTPIIANETDHASPVPHRRVSGYYNGTSVDFNIYLPSSKDSYANRFFQLVYPLQNSTAEDEAIAFGADSGAYTVHVAAGVGYRGDAAVAKFAKTVAREYYGQAGSEPIHGYVYGGSGGSLQVIGALENTDGVWGGGVALVQAVPVSNPNNFAIRAFTGFVLDSKSEAVIDAVRPGGSGDPFVRLEEYERLALEEATALGVPLLAWEDFDGVARNRTKLWETVRTLLVGAIQDADPTYVDDFWSVPGYLGVEDSALGDFFRRSLIEYNDTVLAVEKGADGVPVGIKLATVPAGSPVGLEFTIASSDSSGDEDLGTFSGLLNKDDGSVYIYSDNNATVLAHLAEGTNLHIDNRWYLAAHTWHRHQVPPLEDSYYGYDYLRTANGEPRYPQRKTLLALSTSAGASGGATHTGNIKGNKLIVMDNLVDFDAFPWHADWYKHRVAKALGEQRFGTSYRLYYNEHADHFMGPVETALQARIVDYTGLYEWLLRDLSAWVEGGVEPPVPSRYVVEGGQVSLQALGAKRGGIQPLVELTVDGGNNRTEIQAGEAVAYRVRAEVPRGMGKIVSVEWDFEGTGEFVRGELKKVSKSVDIKVKHVYGAAGTYFPAVRVASHKDGDTETAFARALNLGRVRVVVD